MCIPNACVFHKLTTMIISRTININTLRLIVKFTRGVFFRDIYNLSIHRSLFVVAQNINFSKFFHHQFMKNYHLLC